MEVLLVAAVCTVVVLPVLVLNVVLGKKILCCGKGKKDDGQIKSYKDKSPYAFGDDEKEREFNELQHHQPNFTCKIANKSSNISKNRYQDTVPYDYNIVQLANKKYINASNILPDLIATQDPLPTSDDVFWTMVWQENVRVVVRLSSDVDPSQIPVAVYLPPEKWVVDNLEVTNPSDPIVRSHYIERHLQIRESHQVTSSTLPRDIVHYHITIWNGIPNVKDFLIVMKDIKKMKAFFGKENNPKMLVHCGAGSGRTGAFMAVWQLMDAIDNGLQPSVQEVVQRLRDQRPHMVNTIELYNFVYTCARQYMELKRLSLVSGAAEAEYEHVGFEDLEGNIV